jgi:hypothetical protein
MSDHPDLNHALAAIQAAQHAAEEVVRLCDEEAMAEVDEARLLATTRADVWADEFAKVSDIDRDLMITWFANAIEVGRQAGRRDAATITVTPPRVAVTVGQWERARRSLGALAIEVPTAVHADVMDALRPLLDAMRPAP